MLQRISLQHVPKVWTFLHNPLCSKATRVIIIMIAPRVSNTNPSCPPPRPHPLVSKSNPLCVLQVQVKFTTFSRRTSTSNPSHIPPGIEVNSFMPTGIRNKSNMFSPRVYKSYPSRLYLLRSCPMITRIKHTKG